MNHNKRERSKKLLRLGCLLLAGVFVLSLLGTLVLQIAA
jgi:hypothetical protein